jgi:hypothetical protein
MKCVGLLLVAAFASCKESRPIESFTKPAGKETFDHSIYDALLRQYVDESGMVGYAPWKKNDQKKLDEYLDRVREASPSKMDRNEAIAFWTNVYNAWTIRGILEFYPLKSIKDKVSHLGGYNIWDDYRIAIEGKDLSLNDIEHRILRKMDEPRIHFALVCAAKGCPRLLSEAYAAKQLESQLEKNARHFFGQKQNFELDQNQKVVRLSTILDWYKDDFGRTDKDRLAYYSSFWSPEDREFLGNREFQIEFISYDWNLNEQEKKQ